MLVVFLLSLFIHFFLNCMLPLPKENIMILSTISHITGMVGKQHTMRKEPTSTNMPKISLTIVWVQLFSKKIMSITVLWILLCKCTSFNANMKFISSSISIIFVDSCVRNCRWRPNVHEATELTLAVHSLSIVSTEWSITPDIDWNQDIGSGRNRQFLSIYEDVLQSGITYTVQVFGKPSVTNMCFCLD